VTKDRRAFLPELARLASGRIGGAAASAAWFVVVVHHLNQSAVGDLALLLSLGAMFGLLADGGYSIVLQAIVAEHPERAAAACDAVRRKRLPLGLLAAALTSGVWLATAHDADVRVALAFSVSIVATTIYTSSGVTMRALGHAGYEGANETVSRLGVLALGWWLLDRHGGLLAAAAVYALADVASALVLSVVMRRRFGSRRGPVDGHALSARKVAPVFLAAALGTTYYRIDLLMVHVIKGSPTAALYASSYRVFEAVMLPAGAVAALVVPAVLRASEEERARIALRITGIAAAVTAVGAVVAEVFAHPLIRVVFGARYLPATSSLRVLALATVVTAATTVLAQVHAVWRPARLALVWSVALVANVGLNLVLIPHAGAAGAAWATLICQVAAGVWLVDDTRRVGRAAARRPRLVPA
jgi:O-antigen/teichoic acid export membrane protein